MSTHARAPPPQNMEISVDYLADLMFRKNVHDRQMGLMLPELKDAKDLFLFLVDLFCKGIVLLYGHVANGTHMRVEIDQLTQEQLAVIKQKMSNAGVQCHVELLPRDPAKPVGSTNLRDVLHHMSNTLDLSAYKMCIVSTLYEYQIGFTLMRVIPT